MTAFRSTPNPATFGLSSMFSVIHLSVQTTNPAPGVLSLSFLGSESRHYLLKRPSPGQFAGNAANDSADQLSVGVAIVSSRNRNQVN